MGNKYEILAAKYPFNGYYEASFQSDNFWSAIWYLLKYKRQGYGIINLQFRHVEDVRYD